MSLRAHVNFVIALLNAGILLSLAVSLLDVEAAWITAVVFAGCACGALIRLRLRLPPTDEQDTRNTP
jgi:uncharacterized membrane protein AbrB (regulator of aidB expression)